MISFLEIVSGFVDHSVPTILVIAGLVLFFLPFFKDMSTEAIKSARRYGLVVGVTGIVLSFIIKSPEPQQPIVPIYVLPTPHTAIQEPITPEILASHVTPTSELTLSLPSATPELVMSAVPPTPDTATQEPITPEKSLPHATPTLTRPLSLPSATPEPVTSVIPVWAFEENGVRVNISTSGIYKISYFGDAYSPWPNEQHEGYKGWTTTIRIYINRSVEWGQTDYNLIGPVKQDYYLGPGHYFQDRNQAIASSRGDSRTIRLNEGDYLVFIALDERGRYSDNQGKVDIGITYLGQ